MGKVGNGVIVGTAVKVNSTSAADVDFPEMIASSVAFDVACG